MNVKVSFLTKCVALGAATLLSWGISAQAEGAQVETLLPGKSVPQTFSATDTKTESLDYFVFLPKEYTEQSDKKWPIIVFLHGLGERGTHELDKLKIHGPLKIAEKNPDFNFIVVAPQCPPDQWWTQASADALNTMLDKVLADVKNADSKRVYLTGLSMGGMGTYEWAMNNPERFAAAAPICGAGIYQKCWGFPADKAEKFRTLPFWVFHGDADTAVEIKYDNIMVKGLRAFGVKELNYTIYPGVGHDCWTRTYENPELYKWFLKHSR